MDTTSQEDKNSNKKDGRRKWSFRPFIFSKKSKKKKQKANKPKPVDISSQTQIGDNHYQKIGFYYAIETQKSYSDLLTFHIEERNQIEFSYKKYIDERIQFLHARILSLRNDSKEKLDVIRNYYNSSEALIQERSLLIEKVKSVKKEVIALLSTFLLRKKEFLENRISTRIDKVKGQITKLLDSVNLVNETIDLKDKDQEQSIQNAWTRFIDYLTEEANKKRQFLSLLNTRLGKLNELHVSNKVISILGLAAITSMTTTGWFFSIFAEKSQYGSADKISFILDSLLNFGQKVFQPEQNILGALLNLLIATLIILLALGIITFLFILLDRLVSPVPSQSLPNNSSESIKPDKFEKNGKPKLPRQLSFSTLIWLQNLPYILIALMAILIAIFLLSFSKNGSDNLAGLTNALSGQVVGSSIALAIGGILFIYVNYVIEHRLDSKGQFKALHFWELFVSLSVLLLGFILVLSYEMFGPIKGAKLIERTSFSLFVVMAFTSGLIIAYFAKLSSFFLLAKQTESDIIDYENSIMYYSELRHQKRWRLIPQKDFVHAFKVVNYEIFDSISLENQEEVELLKDQTSNSLRKKIRNLWKGLVEKKQSPTPENNPLQAIIFWRKNPNTKNKQTQDSNTEDPNPIIIPSKNSGELNFDNYIAKEYFTDLYFEIRDKLNVIHQLETRIAESYDEMDKLRKGEEPQAILNARKEKQNIEDQITDVEVEIVNNKTESLEFEHKHQQESQKIWLELSEGYELGQWYLNNKL